MPRAIIRGDTVSAENPDAYDTLVAQVTALRNQVETIRAAYNDLATKYNAHVHVENTAAAYVQNANTAVTVVGSQAATTAIAVTPTITAPLV
jgi:hypothetical protein